MIDAQVEKTEPALVEMRDIWKRFPGVVANRGVSFQLHAGEVHALLGENGAGKTTLMNILSGLYRPDEGQIFVAGHQVDIHSPVEAHNLGIGMVHQHFRLVDDLTVAENMHLGWIRHPGFSPRKNLPAEQRRSRRSWATLWTPSPDHAAFRWRAAALRNAESFSQRGPNNHFR